jgi:hypothetical protein
LPLPVPVPVPGHSTRCPRPCPGRQGRLGRRRHSLPRVAGSGPRHRTYRRWPPPPSRRSDRSSDVAADGPERDERGHRDGRGEQGVFDRSRPSDRRTRLFISFNMSDELTLLHELFHIHSSQTPDFLEVSGGPPGRAPEHCRATEQSLSRGRPDCSGRPVLPSCPQPRPSRAGRSGRRPAPHLQPVELLFQLMEGVALRSPRGSASEDRHACRLDRVAMDVFVRGPASVAVLRVSVGAFEVCGELTDGRRRRRGVLLERGEGRPQRRSRPASTSCPTGSSSRRSSDSDSGA